MTILLFYCWLNLASISLAYLNFSNKIAFIKKSSCRPLKHITVYRIVMYDSGERMICGNHLGRDLFPMLARWGRSLASLRWRSVRPSRMRTMTRLSWRRFTWTSIASRSIRTYTCTTCSRSTGSVLLIVKNVSYFGAEFETKCHISNCFYRSWSRTRWPVKAGRKIALHLTLRSKVSCYFTIFFILGVMNDLLKLCCCCCQIMFHSISLL